MIKLKNILNEANPDGTISKDEDRKNGRAGG